MANYFETDSIRILLRRVATWFLLRANFCENACEEQQKLVGRLKVRYLTGGNVFDATGEMPALDVRFGKNL